MSALDAWVTEYEGTVCGEPCYHIYRCMKEDDFDPDVMYIGADIPVGHQTYRICGLSGPQIADGTWMLIYAHLVPEHMAESEWHGLYGDPDLVSNS